MVLAAATSTVGLTTPLTSTQRPFALWIDGIDHNADVDKSSYELDDPDPTQPARFRFILDDEGNTFGKNLTTQQRVVWQDFAADRTLFQGFIKVIRPKQKGPYARWEVECSDISEILDYGQVPLAYRPAETSQARIQYLLGAFAHADMVSGGFVGNIVTLNPETYRKETVRSALERVLAACGANAEYHVDQLGWLHVYSGSDGSTAPYNVTDSSPNLSTTIPGASVPEYDGLADVDAVQVYGATAAGSGLFYGSNAPRNPPRIVAVDAPYCQDAATAAQVAAGELAQRTVLTRAEVTVEGFDGWQKGQTVQITNSVLGWSAKSMVIKGVTMKVLSGTGIRQYQLACGAPLGRMSRDLAAAVANAEGATQGSAIVGDIGGPSNAGPVSSGYAAVQVVSTGLNVTDTSGTVRVYMGNIPNGDWGLQVVTAGGGFVIIDGTSDMFRIAATGTMSLATVNGDRNVNTSVTLTGLGALSTTPVGLHQAGSSNATTGDRWGGTPVDLAVPGTAWAATSSGGATTNAFLSLNWIASMRNTLDGSNQCVVVMASSNQSGASHTVFGRYYVMAQTAI